MKMTDLFLGELERETGSTRRTLERVPEGRYDWKPHDKSMGLGYLAELVARLPSWTVFTIKQDNLDLATYKAQPWRTTRELLEGFDESVAGAREALANTTDEHLLKPWQLLIGGRVCAGAAAARGVARLGVQSPGAPSRAVDGVFATPGLTGAGDLRTVGG